MVEPAAETAVGAGDDIFPSDQAGETHDALSDQFGVLNDVGGVAHDAGNENLPFGQFDILPDTPLMLVARVGRFDQVGAGMDLQQQVDDLQERQVGGVRSMPAAPADMITYPLGRNAFERVVERLDRKSVV